MVLRKIFGYARLTSVTFRCIVKYIKNKEDSQWKQITPTLF